MPSRRGPDNTVRIAITGQISGVPWANIFSALLTVSGTPSQADFDGWTTAFAAAYKARFAANLPNNCTFQQARAVMFTPGGGEIVSVEPITGGGTSGTNAANNCSAGVISWYASVYWRGGKPRTYLPGIPTTGTTGGNVLTATYQTALQTAATNLRSDINALTSGAITGTQFGFVSFMSGNVARVPPVFYAINTAKVHLRLGTIRRRLGLYIS